MTRGRATMLAVLVPSALAGCAGDKCKSEAPSFQLDLTAPPAIGAAARQIRLEVVAGASGWRKTVDLAESFGDGATSLGILLDPAPSESFDLKVNAVAMDASGGEIGRGAASMTASADGCNRLSLALGPGAADGGAPDAQPADAEPADTVEPDAPDPGDAGDLDAPELDAPDPDAVADDAGVDPDALVPDVELPDAGELTPVPFATPPFNFNPTTLTPERSRIIDCGDVTFNSGNLTFSDTCGRQPPAAVPRMQGGGDPELAVIPVLGLEVAAGSRLLLRGGRPVVFAVFGDARVDGEIDASAVGGTAGAGGNPNLGCFGPGGGSPFNRGGGGGGGFGSAAGSGGGPANSPAQGGSAGTAIGDRDLVPLRGGCNGGRGGNFGGEGGASGGTVQLSASGAVAINAGGAIRAGGGEGQGGSRREGGGGGGSGGGVLVEGVTISVAGQVIANGGGGGGGGPDCNCVAAANGTPGSELSPAGGAEAQNEGGTGGTGGSGALTRGQDGADGDDGQAGGGGGGGGFGIVRMRADSGCAVTGTISPAATGCP